MDEVGRAVDLPLLIGNDPARTGLQLASGTADRLLSHRAVIGLVDAPAAAATPACGEGGSPVWGVEGRIGTLSVAANVAPRLCALLDGAGRAADPARAGAIQRKLQPLVRALDLETDPAPVKYALFLIRHHFSPHVRLPLVEVCGLTARLIAAALTALREDVDFQP